jgi:exosortase
MKKRTAFILLFLGLWGMLLAHLAREWWNNPQYGYGLFVPFLCAWFLWQNRGSIAAAFGPPPSGPPPRLANALLCAGALLLFPLELYRQIAPGLRGFGTGGALLCLGLTYWTLKHLGMKKIPGVIWGVALLFLTSVPWPSTIEVVVIQGLMKVTAQLSSEVLYWVGIPATQRGNLIELESGIVGIDEACSGVRSLQSCLMAAVALSLLFRLSWRRTLALIITGQVLAFAGNSIRSITLTCLAARDGLSAVEKFHDPAGWSILIGVTLVLYLIAWRWEMPAPPQKAVPIGAVFDKLDWSHLPRARAAFSIAVICLAGAQLWYVTRERLEPPLATPSLRFSPTQEVDAVELPVSKGILEQLLPQKGANYQVSSPDSGFAAVYYFFWEPSPENRTGFFHRPDVCMSGIGWEPEGAVKEVTIPLGSTPTQWYLFRFKRGQKRILQAWGVWRDGDGQILNFESGWRKLWGQQLQRLHFMKKGKRMTNTEIASVAIGAQPGDEQKLIQLIQRLFMFDSPPTRIPSNRSHE